MFFDYVEFFNFVCICFVIEKIVYILVEINFGIVC